MISRRIFPCRTAVSLAAMTLRCQFIARRVCGLRSWKQCIAKVAKSWRSRISYSPGSVFRTSLFVALSRRVSSVLNLMLQAREPAGREPSPSAGDTRLRHRGIGFAHDSLLEGTGFELLVRGRVKLVVGRGRQRN